MSNVDLVRDAYAAFGRGDVATVLEAMDPQIEWRQAEGNPYEPSGNAWIGPDAVMQNLFVKLGTDWDGFAIHPQRFHDAGETVIVEGRYTGTYKATTRSLDSQYCHVFTFRDGKLVRFQQFTDTAQLQDVTGRQRAGAKPGTS